MEKNINNSSEEKSLENLIQENIELTRSLTESVAKINKWIFWQKVKSIITILIVVIPIILGLIYLPPVLANFYESYKSLFPVIDLQ